MATNAVEVNNKTFRVPYLKVVNEKEDNEQYTPYIYNFYFFIFRNNF